MYMLIYIYVIYTHLYYLHFCEIVFWRGSGTNRFVFNDAISVSQLPKLPTDSAAV